MTTHALLHLAAIAMTSMAVVLHPGIRDRSCAGDLVAGVVMLAAMVDAMWVRTVPIVFSMALLVGTALIVSAVRSVRARAGRGDGGGACRSSHTPLGFVVTAACLPFMQVPAVSANAAGVGHAHHGGSAMNLTALVVALAAAYVITSAVAARFADQAGERAHFALMGIGTGAMALAAVL